MGYTTEFEGRFALSKVPSGEVIAKLLSLAGTDGEGLELPGLPDGYCDWELTKDCRGLKWSGAEKFYHYAEWLQFIIDALLKPDGVALSGDVRFQGEEIQDSGVLSVINGRVKSQKLELVSDDANELGAFRDFVLASDYATELLAAWKKHQRNNPTPSK